MRPRILICIILHCCNFFIDLCYSLVSQLVRGPVLAQPVATLEGVRGLVREGSIGSGRMDKLSKRLSHSSKGIEKRALETEVRSLQTRLERTCDFSSNVPSVQHRADSAEAERRARSIIRVRCGRAALFSSDLFGEPAWDMLLELYATELADRVACVSGVCRDSGAPFSTALRWIKMLEDNGWVTRLPNHGSPPQSFLSLTDKSKSAMKRFFAQPELANL